MNDELLHYGILGQQWGKRRFETKDGHLTPAGKKRYDYDEKTLKRLSKNESKIGKTNYKIPMRMHMYGNTAIRKTGKIKKLRNTALLLGGTALASYAVGKNSDKGYSKSELAKESLKTTKDILTKGGKKVYGIIKKGVTSEPAKKVYKKVGKAITSEPAKKIYKGSAKAVAKVARASGSAAKEFAKSLLSKQKEKMSLTRGFDRDDLSTYGEVLKNGKRIYNTAKTVKGFVKK